MDIIWSDIVIFLLLVFFLGTSMCADNMPVCEKDKQHGERQCDFLLFSSVSPLIRHIRIWTTEGRGIASTTDTVGCVSSLPRELLCAFWDGPTHSGRIWKQEILGCAIWLHRVHVNYGWADLSLGIRDVGCIPGPKNLLPVKIKDKLRLRRGMGAIAHIGICS